QEKMLRMITAGVAVLLMSDIHACAYPRSGPEFDELIKVAETEKYLTYTFSVPANLYESGNDAIVALGYARKSENGLYIDHEYEEVQLRKADGNLLGEVSLRPRKGMVAFITVNWHPSLPGMCDTVADKLLAEF